ncbi:glycosyltransferase family 2 protein [Hymenopellis radicata]|nr:glycosyltransferase family 2 protein [Hymenopellis radicata]
MSELVLITGGCGFIGSAVARRLSQDGRRVRVADLRGPSTDFVADIEYRLGDLRDAAFCAQVVQGCDIVMHFAANMGGMGTIHAANDIPLYSENHAITIQLLDASVAAGVSRFMYASSACVYPELPVDAQLVDGDVVLREDDVWARGTPPQPQGLYGLDKLNTELVLAQYTDRLQVRIARFHNIFGPGGAWYNGREKAPAALLRKALVARRIVDQDPGSKPTFEIWGDGTQRRSFLYIEDCVDGVLALMASDCSAPINIGSDRAVSIQELAEMALNCAALAPRDVVFVYEDDKPLGVAARNSENSFALERLRWAPRRRLEDGMSATCTWMARELDRLREGSSSSNIGSQSYDDPALLRRLSKSQVIDLPHSVTFAILLPVTSRSSAPGASCLENLRCFVASLMQTTRNERLGLTNSDVLFCLKVYILIDYDDDFLLQTRSGMNQVEYAFRETELPVKTLLGYHEPGRVCGLWRQCARKAYEDPTNTYFILLGDDVELLSDGWMSTVHERFQQISNQTGAPLGFGCVAFEDVTFPGMPTFPVVHRTHLDMFGGDVIPDVFVNQDGDPYLFQLYRRWGCATMVEGMRLQNNVGGSAAARYDKQWTAGWTYDVLDRATAISEEWLKRKGCSVERKLTIDVVVPSFRVQIPLLTRILALKSSPAVSTMFIIVIDDPTSPNAAILEETYGHLPNVRIRTHSANLGASASRNRGLQESAAEWVLFLDDDIQPEPDLLLKAEKYVRAHPEAAGFVGNVFFPKADTIYTSAIHLSGVTYFWNIAEKIHSDLPWGVTANLMVRRNKDGVLFDLRFPKTGGGEDIDFCVRKRRDGFVFFAAPELRVVHPWWRNGRRDYARFYGWGFGDSNLLKKWPEFTYRDYTPNSAEFLFISVIIATAGIITRRLDLIVFAVELALSTVIVNVIHDMYRLLYTTTSFDFDKIPGRPDERQLVEGPSRVLAVVESTVIRMFSEAGKTVGIVTKGEWRLLGRRFDWFIGRWHDLPKRNERWNGVERTSLIILLLALVLGSSLKK